MSLLTREGYIVEYDDLMPWHIDELTVVAEKSPPYNADLEPFPVFEDRHDGTVSVPRYWGEKNFGRPKKLFGYTSKASRLEFKGELRSDLQKNAVSSSIKHLECYNGGVLSTPTGSGKTVLSLYVACAIKLKTLVVVHKQFLLDQWEERIKKFVPLARIGRLQRDIEDTDGCDIVVGMLQSIAMRQYDDVFSDFGLVIFDEVHVVPAPVFSRALLKLSAPYLLGLSATPVRKDGLSRVIHWFIGPTFFEHTLTGKDNVVVEVVNFKLNRTIPTYNMAAATTIICNMVDRNDMLVSKVKQLVYAGHKVILLSDRRAHCEALKLQLKRVGIDGALYLGGMKPFELERSIKKDVLLCTYSMAQDALDIPSLDALVMATPRSSVVQACGRILHGKTALPPTIVDVVDHWPVGKAQFNKRCVYYKSAGFTVR